MFEKNKYLIKALLVKTSMIGVLGLMYLLMTLYPPYKDEVVLVIYLFLFILLIFEFFFIKYMFFYIKNKGKEIKDLMNDI